MEYKIRKGRVTAEQAEDIVAMNARGYCVKEIMLYTGLNQYRVLRFMRDNGITDRKLARRPWMPEDYETLTRMYNERRTIDEMMAVLQRTRASIWAVSSRLRKEGAITVTLGHKRPKREKCPR